MCALLSQGSVQLCVPVLFLLVTQETDIRIRLLLSKVSFKIIPVKRSPLRERFKSGQLGS